MRRSVKLLAATALLVAAVVIVVSAASANSASAKKQYVIGLAAAKIANPAARAMYGGFKYEAQKLGMKVIISDSNLDINKQVSDIDTFTTQGVDAIMIQLVGDPNAVRGPIARAVAKGIKVASFDGLPPFPGVVMNAFQPGKEMGAAAAAWVAQQLKGKGTVEIASSVPIPVLDTRWQSELAVMKKKYPGIKVLPVSNIQPDDANGGRQWADPFLAKYPKGTINAIMVVNDDIAAGVADSLRAAGRHDVILVGLNGGTNGISAIKQGYLQATWDVNPITVGEKAAVKLKAIMDGKVAKSKLPLNFTVSTHVWTKANVGKYVDFFKRIPFPSVP